MILVFAFFFEFKDDFFHKFINGCIGRRTYQDAVLLDFGVGVFIGMPLPRVLQFDTHTKQIKTTMRSSMQFYKFSLLPRMFASSPCKELKIKASTS